ncbi:MAG: heat-inducible transcriptional repressor HrcA [Hyphomicrobiales bacterium]
MSDEKLSALAQLDQRSRDIFRRLVETYIETGEPVGSRTISRILPVNLSPASVRNVMADLEDAGLIFSPHTSAGRLPTQQGLRFFVDALLELGPLAGNETEEIDKRLGETARTGRIEDTLASATNLLSGLSQCAGVVITPKYNPRLKHIEFVPLGPERALVVLVGDDGTVENRTIEVPAGLPPSTLVRASNLVSSRLQGKTIDDVQFGLQSEVEVIRRELDELTARVVETGLATWSDGAAEEKRLIVRGQAHLIESASAMADLERIRQLFEDLEEKREVVRLLGAAEEGEGVRIFIGAENKLFSLSGSSLVLAPYRDGQQRIVGVLGVIGPTRLNYARIIPMVEYTAKAIGRLFP